MNIVRTISQVVEKVTARMSRREHVARSSPLHAVLARITSQAPCALAGPTQQERTVYAALSIGYYAAKPPGVNGVPVRLQLART
jgi:hypothetical protein